MSCSFEIASIPKKSAAYLLQKECQNKKLHPRNSHIVFVIAVVSILIVRFSFVECGTVGTVYKIDGLHQASELEGCTVVFGDIKIEIRAGPSKYDFISYRTNVRAY